MVFENICAWSGLLCSWNGKMDRITRAAPSIRTMNCYQYLLGNGISCLVNPEILLNLPFNWDFEALPNWETRQTRSAAARSTAR